MLTGYEKRLYHCSECGDFEVSTEGYHSCECGKYQGLQQSFEWGLKKHWDKDGFPFPPSSYKKIEKRVDDFAFLTAEENQLIDDMEEIFRELEQGSSHGRGSVFRSDTVMPDGRRETYSFNIELEHTMYRQYQEPRTNSLYLGRDLTEKYNNYRQNLLDDLKAMKKTIEDIRDEKLDLFEDVEKLKETHEWQNNYEMIKINKFVFYPTKDSVAT